MAEAAVWIGRGGSCCEVTGTADETKSSCEPACTTASVFCVMFFCQKELINEMAGIIPSFPVASKTVKRKLISIRKTTFLTPTRLSGLFRKDVSIPGGLWMGVFM